MENVDNHTDYHQDIIFQRVVEEFRQQLVDEIEESKNQNLHQAGEEIHQQLADELETYHPIDSDKED